MPRPDTSPLLAPSDQLERVAQADFSDYDQAFVDLRNAAVQAFGDDENVTARAGTERCEAYKAVEGTEAADQNVLVTAKLVGRLITRDTTWQDIYVTIESGGAIHILDFAVTRRTAGVDAYSVGFDPDNYDRIHDETRDGTHIPEDESDSHGIGDRKAIPLATQAARILLGGAVNADFTQAYGEPAHMEARGISPDTMYAVAMDGSLKPTGEPPAES